MPLFKRPSKGAEADQEAPRGSSDLAVAYGVQRRGVKSSARQAPSYAPEEEDEESGSMIERILKRRAMSEGGLVTGMDPKEDDTLPVDKNNAMVRMAEGGLVEGDMSAALKEDYSDDDTSSLDLEDEEEEDPRASRASIIRKRMLAKRSL